jgi:hypothetical protein
MIISYILNEFVALRLGFAFFVFRETLIYSAHPAHRSPSL